MERFNSLLSNSDKNEIYLNFISDENRDKSVDLLPVMGQWNIFKRLVSNICYMTTYKMLMHELFSLKANVPNS